MAAALLIFLVTYALIAGLRIGGLSLSRPAAAVVGAVAMVLPGIVPGEAALKEAVNNDTLLLLFGMMLVSAHLAEAGLFRAVSRAVLQRAGTPRRLFVAIVVGSGLSSALLVNDTVCLMATPVVVQLVKDARLKPLPFLLALAFGANAGPAMTPTGNPQNMLAATLGHIPFGRVSR